MSKYTRRGKRNPGDKSSPGSSIAVEDRTGARKVHYVDLIDTKKFVNAVNDDCRQHPGKCFINGISRSADGQLWWARDDAEHERWVEIIRKQGKLDGFAINPGAESEFLDAIPEGKGVTLAVRDCAWVIVAQEDAFMVPRRSA